MYLLFAEFTDFKYVIFKKKKKGISYMGISSIWSARTRGWSDVRFVNELFFWVGSFRWILESVHRLDNLFTNRSERVSIQQVCWIGNFLLYIDSKSVWSETRIWQMGVTCKTLQAKPLFFYVWSIFDIWAIFVLQLL